MRKHFLLAIVLLVFSTITFAQQGVVTGTVKAEDGSPLPGATVQIKGTTTGTVTDLDGNYSLPISGVENPTLVFSYVGYLTDEIAVAGQTKIDIKLVTNISTVDEVVVVGYGTQKKSLVTGSIAKVNAEQLVTSAPVNVQQTMQGKTAGVTVSANSGQPGAAPSVRVRGISSNGNTAPIYIVDGIKVGGIEYLDPNDIESLEVLKDAASCAIYGAQGGNGVVYITTKKGKSGTSQVTYDFYFGTQRYSSKLKLLSGPEYIKYIQDGLTYEEQGKNPGESPEDVQTAVNKQLDKFYGDPAGSQDLPPLGSQATDVNTNWLKEITSPAPMTEQSIRFSGGTDKSNYSAGVSYFNQDGVTGGNKANFNRYTIMLSGENKATNWLTVGANATYSRRSRSALNDNSEFGGIYGNAMLLDPLTPTVYANDSLIPANFMQHSADFTRDGNGNAYGMSRIVTNEIINPLAMMTNAHGKFTEDKILAGAYAQVNLLKGLTFKTSYDVDVADNSNIYWSPVAYYDDQNWVKHSSTTEDDERWYTWHFDNVLTYNKSFGKHNFTLMGGTHADEQKHIVLQGTGNNMIVESDAFASPGAAPLDTGLKNNQALANSRFDDPQRLYSIFGRFLYNYNEKYLFNFTIRQDESSMLAPGHQKGLFPSGSVGWVISNEKFWTVPVVNYLKARVSYGTNGNLSIVTPFKYVPTISFGGYTYTDGSANQQGLNGAAPTNLANAKLSWEEIKMWDGAIDMALLNNKVTFTLDYYNKITDGLLTAGAIASYVGNTPPPANSGTVKNTGWEIELGYRKAEGDFQWNVNGNVSFLKNKVTAFGTPNGEGSGANLGINGEVTHIKVGEPIYYMYGYKANGVWQSQAQIDAENWSSVTGVRKQIQQGAMPGDIRVVDVNGDSTINLSDRTKIGSGIPKATMGLNLGASYKGFDISANFIGSFGNDVYFGSYRSDLKVTNKPTFMQTDAWSPTDSTASFFRPTVSPADHWNLDHNSMYVRNGSYVKLKTLTLGYTIPSELSKKISISKFKVYISCNNLLTITKYEGADPEIGTTGESTGTWNSVGIDRGYYPQSRNFLIGANITF